MGVRISIQWDNSSLQLGEVVAAEHHVPGAPTFHGEELARAVFRFPVGWRRTGRGVIGHGGHEVSTPRLQFNHIEFTADPLAG